MAVIGFYNLYFLYIIALFLLIGIVICILYVTITFNIYFYYRPREPVLWHIEFWTLGLSTVYSINVLPTVCLWSNNLSMPI